MASTHWYSHEALMSTPSALNRQTIHVQESGYSLQPCDNPGVGAFCRRFEQNSRCLFPSPSVSIQDINIVWPLQAHLVCVLWRKTPKQPHKTHADHKLIEWLVCTVWTVIHDPRSKQGSIKAYPRALTTPSPVCLSNGHQRRTDSVRRLHEVRVGALHGFHHNS